MNHRGTTVSSSGVHMSGGFEAAAHLLNLGPKDGVCQVATIPRRQVFDPIGRRDGDVQRIAVFLRRHGRLA